MEIILIPFIFAAIFVAFYIPGRVVLGEQKNLSTLGIFSVSIILGIVLWGWQGYIFGFLQNRWLSYFYLLIFIIIFIKKKLYPVNLKFVNLKKSDRLDIFIIVVGVFGQCIQYIRNGQLTPSGLYFTEKNLIDHTWHSALISELVSRFPPDVPGMFGERFTNYHFWFHLVTADLTRVFHIPLLQTQYLGMYLLSPVLLGLMGYALASVLFKSILFRRLLLFFLFFSGDISTLFSLLIKHLLNFNLSLGYLFENSTLFMDHPGTGLATIILLAGIYTIFINIKNYSLKNILISALLIGSIMGFKIYLAIPALIGLFCLTIIHIIKKNYSTLLILIISVSLSLIQFLPFNLSSGGLLFLPFEIPRQFIAQKEFGLGYIDQRWRIYNEHNNYLRIIQYGILMSMVYFFIQFGLKLIGLIPLKRAANKIGLHFYIFFYSILSASIILGLFFYQKVGGANILEFFITASLILSILSSLYLSLILNKLNKTVKIFLILLIIFLVIPRWVDSTVNNIYSSFSSKFSGIPNDELQAYYYLKNNTTQNSLILLMNPNDYIINSSETSLISQRQLFYAGTGVAQKETQEIKRRKNLIDKIKSSSNSKEIKTILKKNKINYLLFYKPVNLKININNLYAKRVYSNNSTVIYKVTY